MYISTISSDTVARLAVKTVNVWGDEVEVDQADIGYLRIISWTLCSCLGVMSRVSRDGLRDKVMRALMTGVPHWLEADRVKRKLGLGAAVAVLERLEGPVPEWTMEDKQTLEVMRSLTQEDRRVEESRCDVDLEQWGKQEEMDQTNNESKEANICPEPKASQAVLLDSDDSDDSDDDLPTYDMSEDTPYDKKPLLYVRDVLDTFADPDSIQQEEGLTRISELAMNRLKYEDTEVVTELLSSTLHLQNKFDSETWVSLRQSALTSVVTCQPLAAVTFLPGRVFDKEVTLDTKFLILDSLVEAGASLRDCGSPHLDKFLAQSITRLCDGGGGAWGRVKVAGLETSLLTQTLVGVSSLHVTVHKPSSGARGSPMPLLLATFTFDDQVRMSRKNRLDKIAITLTQVHGGMAPAHAGLPEGGGGPGGGGAQGAGAHRGRGQQRWSLTGH